MIAEENARHTDTVNSPRVRPLTIHSVEFATTSYRTFTDSLEPSFRHFSEDRIETAVAIGCPISTRVSEGVTLTRLSMDRDGRSSGISSRRQKVDNAGVSLESDCDDGGVRCGISRLDRVN